MKKVTAVALAMLVTLALTGRPAAASEEQDHAALAKALKEAPLTLQRGLAASAKGGKPISAKYEVEDGKLQLSVYTMKGDKFSEVIVDHKSGKVTKAEVITKDDDLKAAKAQSQTMAKAKRSLAAAASDAVKANAGYRAISVMPSMKDDHAVAEVTLLKGTDWKTATEKLD